MAALTPLEYWRRALEEEIGIILTIADASRARGFEGELYEARKTSGDAALQDLMIVRPGDAPGELWIIRKATDMSDVKV